MKHSYIVLFALSSLYACRTDVPIEVEEFAAGGIATTYLVGRGALSKPSPNLSPENESRFTKGDALFTQHFVTDPDDELGGLGPLYIQNSCIGCHIEDGRSAAPSAVTDLSESLLLRLSMPGAGVHGEPLPVPFFGDQLQTKAVLGDNARPEGYINITYIDKIVEYKDGNTVVLKKPAYTINNAYTSLPSGVLTSPRIAPPVFGMGLLEAISEADILLRADENDADGDGISGKPNYVLDVLTLEKRLGRFGWKANQPDVNQQAAAAFSGDMGITSPYFPIENCEGQSNCPPTPTVNIDNEFIHTTAFYLKGLAVPAARDLNDLRIQAGRNIFYDLGCDGCHTPRQNTASGYEIAEISNQVIYPYTDLLLHDMGEDLADGRSDFDATGSEWRTPPLWGIGLAKVVNPKAGFLHDGRANTIEEAILWHDGEAASVRDAFTKLSKAEREKLIDFINAL